jgi:hypothetical protein
MGKTEDSSSVWGAAVVRELLPKSEVEAAELGAAEDMGGEGQVDGRRETDEEEVTDAPATRRRGQQGWGPEEVGGGGRTGFDQREKRVRAHLFRRLRRWVRRRHVGFRWWARGRGSGDLHTIQARSDKWSWRRQKG